MIKQNFKIQELKKLSNYKKLRTIGDAGKNKHYIYKYMNVERALEFISKKQLRFVQPKKWSDSYENRFYIADYSNLKSYKPPEKIYSTCTTLNKSSEAAWKMYSSGAKGLDGRCILFKMKRAIFLKCLDNYSLENKSSFYEGKVNYLFYDSLIDTIHLKNNPHFLDYFGEFNLEKYLNLLLIKRQAFEYENELRYFILEDEKTNNEYINVEFNVVELIDSIWFDEYCSEDEINLIRKICSENKLKITPKKFSLHDKLDRDKIIKIDSIN